METLRDYEEFVMQGDAMDSDDKNSIPAGSDIKVVPISPQNWPTDYLLRKIPQYVVISSGVARICRVASIIEFNHVRDSLLFKYQNPDKTKYPNFEVALRNIRFLGWVKSVGIHRNSIPQLPQNHE